MVEIEGAGAERFPQAAQAAIEAANARVERASSASDTEAVIGASKELIETVAKCVLDVLGHPYGSNASPEALATQALDALKLHPRALQGRSSLRRLSSSLIATVQAIGELRNTDGTGHGRGSRSNLSYEHACLIEAVSKAWCQWLLTATAQALSERAALDGAIRDISGGESYSRGKLAMYLADLKLDDLGSDDQRKLGLAVARRWTVNGTFMVLMDVVDPLVEGQISYPAAFREGIVEGLILDRDGYLRTSSVDIERAVKIGLRLPGDRLVGVFGYLAERIDDAESSPEFDQDAASECAARLSALAREQQAGEIRDHLDRMAAHLEGLAQARAGKSS